MRCGHIDVSPDQCDGQSAKPQIRVTQPATVTACACGWPRVLAMCPGSQPAMQNTATTLATRMIRTIQAKISSPLIAPSRKRYAIRISAAAYRVASLIGGEVHFEIALLYLGGGPRTSRSPRPRTMIGGMSEMGQK